MTHITDRMSAPRSRSGCLLLVILRLLDLAGLLLRQPDELIDARVAAELVLLPADHPREAGVRLRQGDRTDLVAGLRVEVVLRLHAFERLGGRAVAVRL